mmetsp:Transcript_29216/g.98478  ORF Transcript_29216/g.98478 Transcript_29216/m.98478 type:complete len:248 (-) Transcript_29216:482-1225(-)
MRRDDEAVPQRLFVSGPSVLVDRAPQEQVGHARRGHRVDVALQRLKRRRHRAGSPTETVVPQVGHGLIAGVGKEGIPQRRAVKTVQHARQFVVRRESENGDGATHGEQGPPEIVVVFQSPWQEPLLRHRPKHAPLREVRDAEDGHQWPGHARGDAQKRRGAEERDEATRGENDGKKNKYKRRKGPVLHGRDGRQQRAAAGVEVLLVCVEFGVAVKLRAGALEPARPTVVVALHAERRRDEAAVDERD